MWHLYLLWKTNIYQVIINTLEQESVLPPLSENDSKRQSGRPTKRRFRIRSKYPKPENSKVICKKCDDCPGQNRLTCDIRKTIEALQEEQRNIRRIIHLKMELWLMQVFQWI